jgi:hypothetical protein
MVVKELEAMIHHDTLSRLSLPKQLFPIICVNTLLLSFCAIFDDTRCMVAATGCKKKGI